MKTKRDLLGLIISMALIGSLLINMSCDPSTVEAFAKYYPIYGDNEVPVNMEIILDGSSSSGPIISYIWNIESRPEGSTGTLKIYEEAKVTFTPDIPGEYIFELEVSSTSMSNIDRLTIIAVDNEIFAYAGPDQIQMDVGSTIYLEGTVPTLTDPELTTNASWVFLSKPNNSSTTINNNTSFTPSFIMDEPGSYEVEFTVEKTEDPLVFDKDTVQIKSDNPWLISFDPQHGLPGTQVTMKVKNLSPQIDGNTVKFNDVIADEIISTNDTMIVAIVPEGATTGYIRISPLYYHLGAQSSGIFVVSEMLATIVLDDCGILDDVTFFNQMEGVAVGEEGLIYTTYDGGFTWSSKSNITNDSYTAVSFGSSNTGYIVGQNGTVLKTTNGGNTWNGISSGTSSQLNGVSFVDENTGYISGSDTAVILKTEDGGLSWEDVKDTIVWSGGYNDIFFITEEVGIASAQYDVFSTASGGSTWVTAQSGVYSQSNYQISMVNEDMGWIAGYNGRISITNNGGNSFSSQESGTSNQLKGIHFIDENNGMVVGYNNTILKTTDGGGTWEEVDIGLVEHFYYGVHMLEADVAIIIGYNTYEEKGVIIRLN